MKQTEYLLQQQNKDLNETVHRLVEVNCMLVQALDYEKERRREMFAFQEQLKQMQKQLDALSGKPREPTQSLADYLPQ